MKRLTPILATLAALSACAPADHSIAIDEAFKPLYEQFKSEIGADPYNTPISFVETFDKAGVVGFCSAGGAITVLRSFWDAASDKQRHTLVFHELGHCVLNRVHTTGSFPDYCPTSIMNPSLVPDSCINTHEAALITELKPR